MKRKLFTLLLALFIMAGAAFANIDVVYPTSNNITVNTPTMFFIGNTKKGAKFNINSTPVKLWDGNFFVQNVPLKYGKNVIKLVSVKNGRKEQKTYIVNRPKLK